jgi:hypothetical protein
VNLDGVFAEVVASLDRPTTRTRGSRRSYGERLVTGWRGARKLDVSCEYATSGANGLSSRWHVVADVDGCPPLLVHLNRRGRADAEAAVRGDISVVPTGDAAFDEAWTIEGAPRKTVATIFSSPVRDAVSRLAATGVKLGAFDALNGNGVVYVSELARRGMVKVSASGPYDTEVVLRGIDLAVAVCDAIAAVVDARQEEPPSPAVLAAEEADVKAVLANDPGSMEGRLWRRLSTRTRVLVVVLAIVLGIYTLWDLGRQALSFLH